MANHQYQDALNNFRCMAQKLAEISISEIELDSESKRDSLCSEKQSIKASDMQDMASFCSKVEKYVLPVRLLRYIDIEDESSDSDRIFDCNKRHKILLQMGAINSGYCLAQSGYVRNAIVTYSKAAGSDFDVVIMYNLAILQLLRKKPDLIGCLLYLRLVIDHLAHEHSAVWLNLTLIKQGCLRIIEVMKHMIYDFEKQGMIDSLEQFNHKVFSRVTVEVTIDGIQKKKNN